MTRNLRTRLCRPGAHIDMGYTHCSGVSLVETRRRRRHGKTRTVHQVTPVSFWDVQEMIQRGVLVKSSRRKKAFELRLRGLQSSDFIYD